MVDETCLELMQVWHQLKTSLIYLPSHLKELLNKKPEIGIKERYPTLATGQRVGVVEVYCGISWLVHLSSIPCAYGTIKNCSIFTNDEELHIDAKLDNICYTYCQRIVLKVSLSLLERFVLKPSKFHLEYIK